MKKFFVISILSLILSGTFGIGFATQGPVLSSVPDDVIFYQPTKFTISKSILQNIYTKSNSLQDFKNIIKASIVKQLLEQGFTGFVIKPFENQSGTLILSGDTFFVDKTKGSDLIDVLIDDGISKYKILFNPIVLYLRANIGYNYRFESALKIVSNESLHDIYLFENQEQLELLGYELISYRTRKNRDESYRRWNIMTAFANFGNVRLILPEQSVSYMDNINFDPKEEKRYKFGHTIVDDKLKYEYGGGLCGGSTAIFQGVLMNSGIQINSLRSHSKRLSSLYNANINGQYVTTPGLDATIYLGQQDFVFENTTKYPIVVVSNFDGTYGSEEQNFTVGLERDKNLGNRSYIGRSSGEKTICYYRNINSNKLNSCYKEVF